MNNVRWILALAILATLILIYAFTGEAHNVSVAFPNEVVVDIGDMARWLTLNPNGTVPNPSTTIQIWAHNGSGDTVGVCATVVTNGSKAKVSCPPEPISIPSGGWDVITCSVDINAFTGSPSTKTFTGGKYVDHVELNILVIDAAATDCSTYTTLYNWYVEDINIVILDTNDTSWTKVYEKNGADTTGISWAMIKSKGADPTGFPYCAADVSSTTAVGTAGTGCRTPSCYVTSGSEGYPTVFKFSDIDTSTYTECYVVAYIHPDDCGSYHADGFGIFIQDEVGSCLGPSYARAFYYNPNNVGETWWQIVAPVPTQEFNMLLLVQFNDFYPIAGCNPRVDDVRVYCR